MRFSHCLKQTRLPAPRRRAAVHEYESERSLGLLSDWAIYNAGFAADKQAKDTYGEESYLENDYKMWALGNLKACVQTILDRFPDRKYARLFIGGKGNYRDAVAKIQPYKGNRDKAHRPKYYEELRLYLVERFGAEYSHGREADDEVSIIQFSNPDKSTVIVSYDKDLKNTPGWNYNPVKKELTYISKKEADLNFIGQIPTGDSTDNIRGIKGFGPKSLIKLRSQCQDDPKLMRKEIDKLFRTSYGATWEAALHETATLLWIQRKDWINYDGSKIEKPTTNEVTPE